MHNVVKEKTTVDLMKALFSMYEKPSANNKVHLMKKLFNLKMAKNASAAQHLNEFNTITNQLFSVEIDFDDEICALIIFGFFTKQLGCNEDGNKQFYRKRKAEVQ